MQQEYDRITRQVTILEAQLNESPGKKQQLQTEIRLNKLYTKKASANPAAQFILQHHIGVLLNEASAHEMVLALLRTGKIH